MVCERWCVTKMCVKEGVCVCVKDGDGVWQRCMLKMVCDNDVCGKIVRDKDVQRCVCV